MDEESKARLMNNEEDPQKITELSVIDRLILSNELTNLELLQETFTIFTSVSIRYLNIKYFFIVVFNFQYLFSFTVGCTYF